MTDNFTYIKNFFHFNEIKDYYQLEDMENIFNSLSNDIKNDLSIVTNSLYKTFVKKLKDSNQYTMNLDGMNEIDGFNCSIQIYVNNLSENKKICLTVSNYNNYDSLQNIIYNNINIECENSFKNYIYNILFFCHLFVKEYKYSPLFYSFYHKNDIIEMNNIRKRNIKLFGKHEECCVCYDQTIKKTICDHPLCSRCLNKIPLNNRKCPMCREFLSFEDEMEYNDNNTATIYVSR